MPMIKWSDLIRNTCFLSPSSTMVFVIVRDKGDMNALNDAINKLRSYTKIHFGDEQKALEEINYPLLEEHITIHQKLLQQVAEFQKRIKKEGEVLRIDLYLFLRGWLVDHILMEDIKYSE